MGHEDGFGQLMMRQLNQLLERRFPERRVFLRSDNDTRYLRLSPTTQVVAVTGVTIMAVWMIIASAILLMDSIGSGTFARSGRTRSGPL